MLGLRLTQRVSLATAAGRRAQSSMIPPKVANIAELGQLTSRHPQAHPETFAKMKYFYRHIPKGNAAPSTAKSTYWSRYQAKYIETNSLAPLAHLFLFFVPFGYTVNYFIAGHHHPHYEFH
ncbi:hypothetical protein CXG81DRAFT_25570 [Caulochytrium protostelioides]|uniref:Uncharacterized protein n=1 Tax=Caulochytrium protostelioides TaxID=1555241 RepID=A0A4P9X9G8_9FUNG|nr:hypothetical protein CXG81DRAFT_25570 [Caulochytrium protostelioides]|eukprot:RKP01730.1 hypothetical protein CXG81DRAFT_25570 [Caulochytrium protostelioides]